MILTGTVLHSTANLEKGGMFSQENTYYTVLVFISVPLLYFYKTSYLCKGTTGLYKLDL